VAANAPEIANRVPQFRTKATTRGGPRQESPLENPVTDCDGFTPPNPGVMKIADSWW